METCLCPECGDLGNTTRAQYPLIKEYSLNGTRVPNSATFLNSEVLLLEYKVVSEDHAEAAKI